MKLNWKIIKHFPLAWSFIDSVTCELGCQPGKRVYNKHALRFGAYELSVASEVLWAELYDGTIDLVARCFIRIHPVTVKRFVCLFEDLPADEMELLWNSM